MSGKVRLDIELLNRGFAISRERARSIIMSGLVFIDNQKADKAGIFVNEATNIEVRGSLQYVSRGGIKLYKSLKAFGIDLVGKIAMDIGASTGGFTDCMLQNGAAKVYAVDVGYGQLAWKLRCDPRVINMERTNIRFVTPAQIDEMLDFVTIDVAFISLKLVLPVAFALLSESGEAVALVKPQFEAGREKVGKKGVVRDKQVHLEVAHSIIEFAKSINFEVLGFDYSPVKGPEGNIEYLLYIKKSCNPSEFDMTVVEKVVSASHDDLR